VFASRQGKGKKNEGGGKGEHGSLPGNLRIEQEALSRT
jgi:hypothetical protein